MSWLIASGGLASSCASLRFLNDQGEESAGFEKSSYAAPLAPLTQVAENIQGRYSPDGKRIIYVSFNRPRHTHTQIYEMTLATKIEKRLTYQSGVVAYPQFAFDGQGFYYASTTDETKESSPRGAANSPAGQDFTRHLLNLKPFTANLWLDQLFEIYFHNLKNSEISRLTYHRGYDGHFALSNSPRSMFYVSLIGNSPMPAKGLAAAAGGRDLASLAPDGVKKTELIEQSLQHKGPMMRYSPVHGMNLDPNLSSDGVYISWVESSFDQQSSTLRIRNLKSGKSHQLSSPLALLSGPKLSRNHQWVVASLKNAPQQRWKLYVLDLSSGCWSKWTEDSGTADEWAPDISPDDKSILFTSNITGSSQLYFGPYTKASSCGFQAEPLKL